MLKELSLINLIGLLIYGAFGWFISDYFFSAVFGKDLPWWADVIIGAIASPVLVMADVIVLVLTFFIDIPLWQNI